MTTPNSCQKITLSEGLNRLPGPHGERFVGLLEHGSLVVELYAPRGHDPQTPHSRDEVLREEETEIPENASVRDKVIDFICGNPWKSVAYSFSTRNA